MERYKNLDGDSGVVLYEIGVDSIWVVFANSSRYLYTYAKTGARNVDQMKQFAVNGRGLNSFINTNPAVRNGWEKRER